MRCEALSPWNLDGGKSSRRVVGFLLASLIGLLLPSRAACQSDFFTVTPCRLVDTRRPSGPYGGPALLGGQSRVFTLAGQCGIPDGVGSVSVNVTVTGPTAAGDVVLFEAGTPLPLTSTINYSAGQTRANNAVAVLDPSGGVNVYCDQPVGSTAEIIIDVNGYFPVHTPQVYEVTLGFFRIYCGIRGSRDIYSFFPSTDCVPAQYFAIRCGLIHIRVGDTITWVWNSGTHSTTSGIPPFGNGNWNSGTQTAPFTFSHTFTQTGTYPYFCSPGHVGNPTIDDPCNIFIRHETGVVIVDP